VNQCSKTEGVLEAETAVLRDKPTSGKRNSTVLDVTLTEAIIQQETMLGKCGLWLLMKEEVVHDSSGASDVLPEIPSLGQTPLC
jgi:hypothetical protein